MGLFDFFKSKSDVEMVDSSCKETETHVTEHDPKYDVYIDQLLKEAVAHKNNKEFDVAVEKLKAAFELMIPDELYGVAVEKRVRLPQYLQLAGRNDEAWNELNNLILFIGEHDEPIKKYFSYSYVYDKMRLHLERRKKFQPAIMLGIESYVFGAIWHYKTFHASDEYLVPALKHEEYMLPNSRGGFQKLLTERRFLAQHDFDSLTAKENIYSLTYSLLAKADKLELHTSLVDLITSGFERLKSGEGKVEDLNQMLDQAAKIVDGVN